MSDEPIGLWTRVAIFRAHAFGRLSTSANLCAWADVGIDETQLAGRRERRRAAHTRCAHPDSRHSVSAKWLRASPSNREVLVRFRPRGNYPLRFQLRSAPCLGEHVKPLVPDVVIALVRTVVNSPLDLKEENYGRIRLGGGAVKT
ncbi:hypothetical protein EVAR_88964_1 [Eumeta japonica]|uniref:Uncharacterized protein n=1 Tax=Eumeta variegata TaxID=151549 RepID=A0A4C1VQG6_EUMVA|nr:hypothetical protein EVAR_88964_1 [Eumeta japonica]